MTTQERIDAFKAEIESWQAKLGIPAATCDLKQAEAILTMSRERLEAMSASEAADAAFVLAQLAFELQRRENGLAAFDRWCFANRAHIPGSMFPDLREKAEQKKISIAYLARRVEFMSQCLMAVQRSRHKETA
jgi:hypothetical protein